MLVSHGSQFNWGNWAQWYRGGHINWIDEFDDTSSTPYGGVEPNKEANEALDVWTDKDGA